MTEEVLYTCLKDSQTKFFPKGNPRGKCSCGGSWMFFRSNNEPSYEVISVYLNCVAVGVQLDSSPVVGKKINLYNPEASVPFDGYYIIDNFTKSNLLLPIVTVRRIRDIDPNEPVFFVHNDTSGI